MNRNKTFLYAINGRVIWISDKIFQIVVLDEYYRTHLIEKKIEIPIDQCFEYTIASSSKFLQSELIYRPLPINEKNEILIYYNKVKCYTRLTDYFNYSYSAAFPDVCLDEEGKIEILSGSLLQTTDENKPVKQRHNEFIKSLIKDKRAELINRFLETVHDLKKANTLDEIQQIWYSLVFERIDVI